MRLISGLLGAALLVITVGSILRNLVVPRGLGSLLVKAVWWLVRWLLSTAARPLHYEGRDRLLAWLAPVVLVEQGLEIYPH